MALDTSAYSSGLETAPPVSQPPVKAIPWASIGWFSVLLIALFAPTVYDMAGEWFTSEEMGHGVFAPLIAGYVIWMDRARLMALRLSPSWFGLAFVVLGFLGMVVGIRGADFFIARMGFYTAGVGTLWTLGGSGLVRALIFPLFILLFMIRIPLFIYTQITFPLQLLASRVAESLLTLIGIPVLRDGNVLELPSQKLSVVEACSGIRSLMSLSMLSLVYGYLFDSKPWMRWVLLALAAPIAIGANAMRVTITGIMSEVDTEMATGIYHSVEGFIMWGVAVSSLLLAHRAVNAIYAWRTRRPAGPAGVPAEVTQ